MVEGLAKDYFNRARFIHIEVWNDYQRKASAPGASRHAGRMTPHTGWERDERPASASGRSHWSPGRGGSNLRETDGSFPTIWSSGHVAVAV